MSEKADDSSVVHDERDGSDVDVKEKQGWNDARAANEDEHSLTIRDALKQYRWAVMWSLIVSMSKCSRSRWNLIPSAEDGRRVSGLQRATGATPSTLSSLSRISS